MTSSEIIVVAFIKEGRRRRTDAQIRLFLEKQKELDITGIDLDSMFERADVPERATKKG
jgi:hypothetical protein